MTSQMTIPDEAVQAAQSTYMTFGIDDEMMREALTAALPFLQGVKVEPVAWSIIFSDHYGVNCETTFKTKQAAEEYVSSCGRGKVVPLYLAPSQRAQALEEAAKVVERRIRIAPSNTKSFRAYQDACRHILSDLRDLSSQTVADGWLPIETAPKDGTDFIGWDGKWPFRCSAGKKYELYPHMDGGPTYRDVWDGHYYDSLTIEHPTHWRPLPASPEATRPTGGSNADA